MSFDPRKVATGGPSKPWRLLRESRYLPPVAAPIWSCPPSTKMQIQRFSTRSAEPILTARSQACPPGCLISDALPDLVKSLVIVEPEGPPFENRAISNGTAVVRLYGLTNIPLTYGPPVKSATKDLPFVSIHSTARGLTDWLIQAENPPKKLPNLAKVPIAAMASEASFHAGYEYCKVKCQQQAGVGAQYLNLSAMGQHGNAHSMLTEKNSWQVAELVEDWIKESIQQ